jgi:hypothetical protein
MRPLHADGLVGAVDTLGGRFPDRDDLRKQVVGNGQSDLVTIFLIAAASTATQSARGRHPRRDARSTTRPLHTVVMTRRPSYSHNEREQDLLAHRLRLAALSGWGTR